MNFWWNFPWETWWREAPACVWRVRWEQHLVGGQAVQTELQGRECAEHVAQSRDRKHLPAIPSGGENGKPQGRPGQRSVCVWGGCGCVHACMCAQCVLLRKLRGEGYPRDSASRFLSLWMPGVQSRLPRSAPSLRLRPGPRFSPEAPLRPPGACVESTRVSDVQSAHSVRFFRTSSLSLSDVPAAAFPHFQRTRLTRLGAVAGQEVSAPALQTPRGHRKPGPRGANLPSDQLPESILYWH